MKIPKKRLTIATGTLGALGMLAAFGTVGTHALFDAQTSPQTNSITAGTVSLDNATSASETATCTVTNTAPGDAPTPCTYTVNYTGSIPSWLLLDVSVDSTAANPAGAAGSVGSEPLYDGTPNGLQLSVTGTPSSQSTYVQDFSVPAGSAAGGTSTTTNETVYPVSYHSGGVSFTNGQSETFTVLAALPPWAENQYQGSKATITLTAHVVQYTNNSGNDCYLDACNLNGPYIIGATASATGNSITLDYNGNIASNDPNLGNFYVTDVSQSGTQPVTATVSSIGIPGTDQVTLNLSQLSNGQPIAKGDYLDFFYDSNSSGEGCTTGTWYTSCGAGGKFIAWSSNGALASNQMLSLIPVGA